MDIIDDIRGGKKEIINCIKKHGSVREHNYWFFCNQQTDYAKIFFFKFKDAGIFSIRYKSGIWEFIGEVLAPEKKRLKLFDNFFADNVAALSGFECAGYLFYDGNHSQTHFNNPTSRVFLSFGPIYLSCYLWGSSFSYLLHPALSVNGSIIVDGQMTTTDNNGSTPV